MNSSSRGIAILGSTGSIGTQALEVLEKHPDRFTLELLTAHRNADLLITQARRYQPNTVVITDTDLYVQVKDALADTDVKVFAGADAVTQAVQMSSVHTVLTAMVGYAGLQPTIAAIEAGKDIALANKETLVVAGELITRLAREKGVNIYPVDSEHSAIFQCITGEFHNRIEKIYLTASGGPFRGRKRDELRQITPAQALKHPNWTMGAKITIDSASLMNKGLEVIEAHWLFALAPDQIEVIVHPQSIIHSLVQFEDGSLKAQLGLPDMRLPIQYALSYPHRLPADFERFNFMDFPQLTFEKPDTETFRNLALAYEALRQGGNRPCVLNAANEVAVEAFLNARTGFLEMSDLVESCLQQVPFTANPTYEALVESNHETRVKAEEWLSRR